MVKGRDGGGPRRHDAERACREGACGMNKITSLNGHRKNGAKSTPALITGGAGFIGTNLADRLLSNGIPVIVLDNLSREGVEQNLEWLVKKHPGKVDVRVADIRDENEVR